MAMTNDDVVIVVAAAAQYIARTMEWSAMGLHIAINHADSSSAWKAIRSEEDKFRAIVQRVFGALDYVANVTPEEIFGKESKDA